MAGRERIGNSFNDRSFPSGLIKEAKDRRKSHRPDLPEGPLPQAKIALMNTQKLADPDKEYLVGGTLVRGSVFPEGQLPANARPASPAPWRHLVKPPEKERQS